jgi:hypothetical protein
MYVYSFYAKTSGIVELQIQSPGYVNVFEILKTTSEEEGIIATYNLGKTVQLVLLKQHGCWMFALGQSERKGVIPGNWVISIQQNYTNNCSSLLKIRASSPILIRRKDDKFESIDIPEILGEQRTYSSL